MVNDLYLMPFELEYGGDFFTTILISFIVISVLLWEGGKFLYIFLGAW